MIRLIILTILLICGFVVDIAATQIFSRRDAGAFHTGAPVESSLNLDHNKVSGGDTLKGAIQLATPAATDLTFNMTTKPANAQLPAQITVRRGEAGAVFAIRTSPVSEPLSVEISARHSNGSASLQPVTEISARLQIVPGILKSLALDKTTVVAGSNDVKVNGTVTIERQAPSGGVDVLLSMNGIITIPPGVGPESSFAAIMPSTVKVQGGATSANFTIDCVIPITVAQQGTLTASLGGASKSASLSIQPLRILSLSILPAGAVGPFQAVGTVTLNAPVSGSTTVQLTTSDLNLVRFGIVGNTQSNLALTFQSGQNVKTFQLACSSVTQLTTVHITAALNSVTFSRAVTVRAP
jgi:hypothetical protein